MSEAGLLREGSGRALRGVRDLQGGLHSLGDGMNGSPGLCCGPTRQRSPWLATTVCPRLCFLSRLPGAPSGTFTNLFSLGSSEWVLFKAMTPDPGSEQDGSQQRATRPQRPSRVLSVGAAAPRGRVMGRARGEEPGALAQLCLQLVLAPACARLLDLPGSLGGSSGTERCPGRSRPRSLPV